MANKLRKIPVVVQLYEKEIHKADLREELKINQHSLDRELVKQPAKYAFWAALYSTVAAKVARLQEELDNLESKLYIKYSETESRTTDIKHHVTRNQEYRILRARLRRWNDSERNLKFAVKGFEQRKDVLQTLCANQRREWDSDVKSRKRSEEEE